MNRNTIVEQFKYTNPFTNKIEFVDKYNYTLPNRDYEAEERYRHYLAIRYSNVSDPELCEDSLNYFECKKGKNYNDSDFVIEYDLLHQNKRNNEDILKDYNNACYSLKNTDYDKLNGIINRKKNNTINISLSKKERKILSGYYRSLFMKQRLRYYDKFYMNSEIGCS